MELNATDPGALETRGRVGKGAIDQAALERLVQSLGTLKGVAMKAGQIMSYADETLPEEARRILATLQTHSAHVPFARMRGVVLDELGTRGEALVAKMERRPVAAASIGQVHRGTLPSEHRVAVKTGLAQLVADKRAIAELNLPGELLFLFRIRFGLHALLSRIDAEANWYQMERARS